MTLVLVRILIYILAIWILVKLLTSFLTKNKTAASKKKKSALGGNMVKDPVCGMYMDPRLAVKHETKTGVFYFCSEKCKDKFLQAPSEEKSEKSSSGE